MTRLTIGFFLILVLRLMMPFGADAQSPAKVPRIGMLSTGSPATTSAFFAPFLQALRELGWVEGQNVVVEYRGAEGHYDRLPELAVEFVRLPVDLIVAFGPHAIAAAKQATSAIPIVMAGAIDPVGTGLVANLARPGGNVTGTAFAPPEIAGKILEVLTEVVPQARRVAVLWNPTVPGIAGYALESQVAERALGVTLQPVEVRTAHDFDTAFAKLLQDRPDALYVVADPITASHHAQILDFAAQHRVPAIYTTRPFVDAGGLLSYGPSFSALYARPATYVDKILKGAKPADLPVEQPMKFELVINLKTAQALGLTIPPTLLFLADEVIR
jgi:putative tryptophan/tyrosine transport system substrate-binding protein